MNEVCEQKWSVWELLKYLESGNSSSHSWCWCKTFPPSKPYVLTIQGHCCALIAYRLFSVMLPLICCCSNLKEMLNGIKCQLPNSSSNSCGSRNVFINPFITHFNRHPKSSVNALKILILFPLVGTLSHFCIFFSALMRTLTIFYSSWLEEKAELLFCASLLWFTEKD